MLLYVFAGLGDGVLVLAEEEESNVRASQTLPSETIFGQRNHPPQSFDRDSAKSAQRVTTETTYHYEGLTKLKGHMQQTES